MANYKSTGKSCKTVGKDSNFTIGSKYYGYEKVDKNGEFVSDSAEVVSAKLDGKKPKTKRQIKNVFLREEKRQKAVDMMLETGLAW